MSTINIYAQNLELLCDSCIPESKVELKKALEIAQAELTEAQTELAECNANATDTNTTELEAKIAELESQIATLQAQYDETVAELDKKDEAKQLAEVNLAVAQNKLATANTTIVELQEQLNECQNDTVKVNKILGEWYSSAFSTTDLDGEQPVILEGYAVPGATITFGYIDNVAGEFASWFTEFSNTFLSELKATADATTGYWSVQWVAGESNAFYQKIFNVTATMSDYEGATENDITTVTLAPTTVQQYPEQ